MNTITFNLIEGRTEDEMYIDIALLNDYSSTIENIETFTQEGLTNQELIDFVYPVTVVEDSKKVFTLEGGLFNIEYKTSTTIPNPITNIVFGKDLAVKKFGKEDSTIIGDAALLRAQLGYNLG